MSRNYDVYFRFVEPFSVLVEADDPSGAVQAFYENYDRSDLIWMLVQQGFQDAGIDTVMVVDIETGEEFPLDPMED